MRAARKAGSKLELQQKSDGQCAAIWAVIAARHGSALASHIVGDSMGTCASLPRGTSSPRFVLRQRFDFKRAQERQTPNASPARREPAARLPTSPSAYSRSSATHRRHKHTGERSAAVRQHATHAQHVDAHAPCAGTHHGLCRKSVASASVGTRLSLRLARLASLVVAAAGLALIPELPTLVPGVRTFSVHEQGSSGS